MGRLSPSAHGPGTPPGRGEGLSLRTALTPNQRPAAAGQVATPSWARTAGEQSSLLRSHLPCLPPLHTWHTCTVHLIPLQFDEVVVTITVSRPQGFRNAAWNFLPQMHCPPCFQMGTPEGTASFKTQFKSHLFPKAFLDDPRPWVSIPCPQPPDTTFLYHWLSDHRQ